MCGIVGAISKSNVVTHLIDTLKCLEYRGYDSAGMVLIDSHNHFKRERVLGKVIALQNKIEKKHLHANIGMAHTRWATHGIPSEKNAHPHIANNSIAIVHNGIIENHENLRKYLSKKGCIFTSKTDSELISHLVYLYTDKGLKFLSAVKQSTKELQGAYAITLLKSDEPKHLIALRHSSPLVIGIGSNGNYVASDELALLSVANKFIYLEEDDIADVYIDKIIVYDKNGNEVNRKIHRTKATKTNISKGNYRHFMLKEIFEQPDSVYKTMLSGINHNNINSHAFGKMADKIFRQIKHVYIVACGTSYHAGLVGKYWIEEVAKIPCDVEISSENRYREKILQDRCLFIAISQSGETADTLAALRQAKKSGYFATLAICNVKESSIARESDLQFITSAGREIAVASTKSFTAQLTALMLFTMALSQYTSANKTIIKKIIREVRNLPAKIYESLMLDPYICRLTNLFKNINNALFIARNIQLPIAMEGALKMREISYIHAEAYPAGELKHGTIALIDGNIINIVLAPSDKLLIKIKSNIDEILARNGKLIIFTDSEAIFNKNKNIHVIVLPTIQKYLTPFIYAIVMQLLAYYVAVSRKTDIDQPRNLAKTVTVE